MKGNLDLAIRHMNTMVTKLSVVDWSSVRMELSHRCAVRDLDKWKLKQSADLCTHNIMVSIGIHKIQFSRLIFLRVYSSLDRC